MLVGDKYYHTIWRQGSKIMMIDQNKLPFSFEIATCNTYQDTCRAIKDMTIRGAGAIGAAAACAMLQAFLSAPKTGLQAYVDDAKAEIEATRPTARNLFYATEKVFKAGLVSLTEAIKAADGILKKDIDDCTAIGNYGNELIKDGFRILTHCNAGWLAFVDKGTALSPIYAAQKSGKKVFVFTDETRPRGQGARLTAWELTENKIPNVVIPDNAAASLMSQGKIDMIVVGADRIAANGDTANKIGTLDRAILAKEFGIPFYIAAPLSTFDLNCVSGEKIPIEQRAEDEVLFQTGIDAAGNLTEIRVCAPNARAINPSFDVTPARYISGIITEEGVLKAEKSSIEKAFTSCH
jgi:S-methyl-5-thioribose-1-phosphate isomerase